MQTPPMYSAVSIGARGCTSLQEGLEVERRPRTIEVYSIELVDYFPPDRAIIQVECSKGVYKDFATISGQEAGCGVMSCLCDYIRAGFP